MCDFPLLSCRLAISYGKDFSTRHYMNRLTARTRNTVSIQAYNNILVLYREIQTAVYLYIARQIVVLGILLCSTLNSIAVGLPYHICFIAFALMRSVFRCAQTVLMLICIRGGDKSGRTSADVTEIAPGGNTVTASSSASSVPTIRFFIPLTSLNRSAPGAPPRGLVTVPLYHLFPVCVAHLPKMSFSRPEM